MIVDRGTDIIAKDEMYGEERVVARVQYTVDYSEKRVMIGISDFLPHLDAYPVALEMIETLVAKYPKDEGWQLVTTPTLCQSGHALIVRANEEGHDFFDYVGPPEIPDSSMVEIRARLTEAEAE